MKMRHIAVAFFVHTSTIGLVVHAEEQLLDRLSQGAAGDTTPFRPSATPAGDANPSEQVSLNRGRSLLGDLREDCGVLEIETVVTGAPPASKSSPADAMRLHTTRSQMFVRRVERTDHPQPVLAHATDTLTPVFLHDTPSKANLREKLRGKAPLFAFEEVPLRDAIAALREKCEMPVLADIRALEDFGIDLDTPITGSTLRADSLRASLNRLLTPLDLAFVVEDNALLITTKDRENELLELVNYPIPFASNYVDTIDNLIRDSVSPFSWEVVGGAGSIRPFGFSLLIRQADNTHEEINAFLGELEAVQGIRHGEVCVRVYDLRNAKFAAELSPMLASLCNKALADRADPGARVSQSGTKLVVESSSRPFLVYAEEVLRSIVGRKRVSYEWCVPAMSGGRITLNGNVDGSRPALLPFGLGGSVF